MKDKNNRVQKPGLDGRGDRVTLGMLTFSYALAYVDRQMLSLLVEPIKGPLKISDTQFSLIQGSAFVIAYLASAPIFGRLVDVTKRKNILIFGVCAWSLFTALCAFSDKFWELFFFRVGVGLAEGCIFPVAMSMIADSFSRKRTPLAMSILRWERRSGADFRWLQAGW